ncbi:hypothetical protein RchiOBHm_Chr6g0270711 [Rosa chinensis]|uniref:Uncharacterized protein n=1 Tax=Rosa chinensis TaxID=74649 RepID=A0A2P6PQT7_ROSCH|nr:hypothetical protein RchiOBHm_Chr6g0270711 [Rosa chinensis]
MKLNINWCMGDQMHTREMRNPVRMPNWNMKAIPNLPSNIASEKVPSMKKT